jgi:hypothetical protein
MKPQPTDLRRLTLVAVAATALVVAVAAVPAEADSSGSSSRGQVSRTSGSSGGDSGSSSRSGVSSRSGGSSSRSGSSSSQGGSAVRSRSSGSSVSGSGGRAVVTRPSHGRVPPRWSGGGHHYYHGYPHSYYDFRFGFYGYYPYWSWGYPYYGYGYYPPVYASTPGYGMGALDLNVQPKQTEVFVDGQYVGLVKQYDGFPGYLWLESGLYQVAFYRAGYETVFREFEIFTGMVLDVAIEMVPGEAVLPQRAEPRPAVQSAEGREPRVMTTPSEGAPVPYEPSREEPRAPVQAASTHVDLSVEPEEASVYLDGRFVGTGRELAGGLAVAAGQHVMEVVLPGYEQETVRFEARVGLDSAVDVRLEPVGSAGG